MDVLFELTALPNLHPALVHFPIALVAVALLCDLVVVVRPAWVSIDRNGAALWVLAAAGAGVTYAAGRAAADGLGALPAAAEATLASHADAALAVVTGLLLLAFLRAWLAWRDVDAEHIPRDAGRLIALLGGFLVQGMVAYTADLGGALVYRHGVAVSTDQVERLDAAPAASGAAHPVARSGLSHLEDGSLVWSPRRGNDLALGEILEPLGPAGVRVDSTVGTTEEGLPLVASGPALLAFPGTWEDVQVEARVDLTGFDGAMALGARVEGRATGGLFSIRSSGEVSLVARQAGAERILDTGRVPLPRGEITIALSVTGRHWKGFVDGRTVVHGHAALPASGRVALLLDGTRTLRIISVRISPMDVGKAVPELQREHDH